MARTYVVTGAASGIGLATKKLLEKNGNKVVGVDIHDADVVANLATAEGRKEAISKISALVGNSLDAVIANAGSALPNPMTVSINYFGAVAIMEGLRPLLLKSSSPRVAATSSMASLMPNDSQLVDLMLEGKEPEAIARAQALVDIGGGMEGLIYGSSKRALSRWIRRECIKPEWAGAGIPLNAVGPGIVKTPMVADMIATQEGRDALAQAVPMPLNGYIEPENIAALLVWLTSEENSHTTGQTIYIDGGSDAAIRGDNIWDLATK
jgi:NAD(P)-dependent dehydrogenase (short-subunit alcohol dehydrogenase family)